MRNKTQTRVLSLVLALVMLLPLISIPTFAEGEVAGPTSLKVDFEGATSLAAPLAVDGDVTVTGARVEFLNFTNIVTDTWQPFLTATGTATGDFASDNLFGAYRRKKDGSSYAMAHLTGIMIIFR